MTASCAASCTARSRLIVTDGAGAPWHLVEDVDLGPVLVDADHAPAGLAVELVDDGLLHLIDDRGREVVVGGQQFGLWGDDDAGPVADRGRDAIAVGLPQRDQIERRRRGAGLLGEDLRIDGGVERTQRVGDGHRGRHQATGGGPRSLAVQRVVVQIAGHQHVAATAFVDRGPRRRVGPQRECLMLTQVGVQSRCAPTDFPAPLVADHVELSVVGPGSLLGQVPGVAVVHAAGVLGVLRAEDHRVQSRGLQSVPGLVERSPGLRGLVAEVGGGSCVAVRERCEERLRGRFRTVGLRGARAECACGPDEDGHRQQTGDP